MRSPCCACAASGHTAAAPPSIVMKSRRFTALCFPCFDRKDSTPRVRQVAAALRHFNPAHVAVGSFATDQSGPSAARCPLLPQ